MALQDEIREDLQQEVFGEFGKTVTFIKRSSPIYNSRGDLESWTEMESSIVVVPYNIIEDRNSPQPFGELQEGEMDLAVKYDQSVEKEDRFTIENITYKVVEINKNYLPGNVVTILRLTPEEYLADEDVNYVDLQDSLGVLLEDSDGVQLQAIG